MSRPHTIYTTISLTHTIYISHMSQPHTIYTIISLKHTIYTTHTTYAHHIYRHIPHTHHIQHISLTHTIYHYITQAHHILIIGIIVKSITGSHYDIYIGSFSISSVLFCLNRFWYSILLTSCCRRLDCSFGLFRFGFINIYS